MQRWSFLGGTPVFSGQTPPPRLLLQGHQHGCQPLRVGHYLGFSPLSRSLAERIPMAHQRSRASSHLSRSVSLGSSVAGYSGIDSLRQQDSCRLFAQGGGYEISLADGDHSLSVGSSRSLGNLPSAMLRSGHRQYRGRRSFSQSAGSLMVHPPFSVSSSVPSNLLSGSRSICFGKQCGGTPVFLHSQGGHQCDRSGCVSPSMGLSNDVCVPSPTSHSADVREVCEVIRGPSIDNPLVAGCSLARGGDLALPVATDLPANTGTLAAEPEGAAQPVSWHGHYARMCHVCGGPSTSRRICGIIDSFVFCNSVRISLEILGVMVDRPESGLI